MHKNNFDFLRLMFATFVLITHSYSLSGLPENDLLNQVTGGQLRFSSFGVKGFFIISGYLIFQSVLRSRTWRDYMVRRLLRIYPGYIAVLIFAILLCFPLSSLSGQQYLAHPSVWAYLFYNLAMFLPLHYEIANVFATNPIPRVINGVIWTIPYEFLFYILLSFTFLLKKIPKLIPVILVAGYTALFLLTVRYEESPALYFPKDTFEAHLMAHLGLCFFGGAALAAMRIETYRYKTPLFLISCALLLIFLLTKTVYFAQFAILPIVIVLAGTYATKGISAISSKIGDFSYGIYLYGFIVQQTLIHFFRPGYIQLMLISIPITYIFGALSWYLIEKKALTLKKYFP